MHQLTFNEARQAALEGMQRAADHANLTRAQWTTLALEKLAARVRCRAPSSTFIIEEVRAEIVDLPEPPDLRAWGAVTLAAIRRKIVERTEGTKPARSSHLSPKPAYRRGIEA